MTSSRIARLLLIIAAVACVVPYKVASLGRGTNFKPRSLTDVIPDQFAVLGVALLVLLLLAALAERARKHTDQSTNRVLATGALFGVTAGIIVAAAFPPPEMNQPDAGSLVFVYRYERVVLFAGLIGAGIYLMLQMISSSTNRIVSSRFDEILAMIVAFSAVFICGVWASIEIERVGRAINWLSFGLIDWIGAGTCENHRNFSTDCAMQQRLDIPMISAAMLALYFFFVALWEGRRWRLSFVRSIIVQGSVVCAGFLLFEVVSAITAATDVGDGSIKTSRLVRLGPFLFGMALYASLFSFWMAWSRHHSLIEALCEAFGSTDSFRAMVEARLKPHFEIPPRSNSLEGEVRAVVDQAKRNGWIEGLVANARYSRPKHLQLARIADELKVGIAPPNPANVQAAANRIDSQSGKQVAEAGLSLEKVIRRFGDLSPEIRRQREADLEARVCCIVTPRNAGTGWLVGPDLVLTNYHVVMDMLSQNPRITPAEVECRFDFKESLGANYTTYLLSKEQPVVDWSPFNACDQRDSDELPDPKELDFALLRLETRAGELPIGANAEAGAPPRGWISLRGALDARDPGPDLIEKKTLLYILQHPYGGRLKGEYGPVTQVNANGTRIRHEVSTDGGSSGSPCFNLADLSPIALHHAGKHSRTLMLDYNQAVPISLIVKLIKERGKVEAFWDMVPGRPTGR